MFVAAITLHLFRIIFTGAFRKPSRPQLLHRPDPLSSRSSRGSPVTRCPTTCCPEWVWLSLGRRDVAATDRRPARVRALGRALPRRSDLRVTARHRPRVHHPALLAGLLAVHLAIIMIQRHSQFAGPGRREDNVVGTPMWPGYALRSLGLSQPSQRPRADRRPDPVPPDRPAGPRPPYIGTNGAQPDRYLGWLYRGSSHSCPTSRSSVRSQPHPQPFLRRDPFLAYYFHSCLPAAVA